MFTGKEVVNEIEILFKTLNVDANLRPTCYLKGIAGQMLPQTTASFHLEFMYLNNKKPLILYKTKLP